MGTTQLCCHSQIRRQPQLFPSNETEHLPQGTERAPGTLLLPVTVAYGTDRNSEVKLLTTKVQCLPILY